MKEIVVLDGHTLNPGDLSWDGFSRLGNLTVHPRTSAGAIVERAAGAEIILTNKTPLNAATLEQLPRCKYIGVLATGVNVVDLAAARARGITVTNVPGYGTRSVAQHTLALLLELTQGVGHHARTVREGRWSQSQDFCYWDSPQVELHGLNLGIVGAGSIGKSVGALGAAFGMQVNYATRTGGQAELDELLATSDVVSLHCPLTSENREFINARALARMKPTAFLINTSRGPLIHEQDLADALNAGRIAGAALDVLSSEPPPVSNPLLQARNCLITPHLAWATTAARKRLMDIAVGNLADYLEGKKGNVVV